MSPCWAAVLRGFFRVACLRDARQRQCYVVCALRAVCWGHSAARCDAVPACEAPTHSGDRCTTKVHVLLTKIAWGLPLRGR